MMNIWHDLSPERVKETDFDAVIEITKGGKAKYELDKETGFLKLDRVLYTSTILQAMALFHAHMQKTETHWMFWYYALSILYRLLWYAAIQSVSSVW